VIAGRKKTEKKTTQENERKQEKEKKAREHERARWKRRQEGRWSKKGETKRDQDGRVYHPARYVHHRPRRVGRDSELAAAIQSGTTPDTARLNWPLAGASV
jgi:hypothetical protein